MMGSVKHWSTIAFSCLSLAGMAVPCAAQGVESGGKANRKAARNQADLRTLERDLETAVALADFGAVADAILAAESVAADARQALSRGAPEDRRSLRRLLLTARLDAAAWRQENFESTNETDDELADAADWARIWGERRVEGRACKLAAEAALEKERADAWLSAFTWLDRASQVFLDAGDTAEAAEAFLKMAALCRQNQHVQRLGEVHLRLAALDASALPESLTARIAAELERAMPAAAPSGVDLSPSVATAFPSAAEGEIGRLRYVLTNNDREAKSGTLTISPSASGLTDWAVHAGGHVLQFDPARAAAAVSRQIRLLPGQQLPVYVERLPGSNETFSLAWTAGEATSTATGTCDFRPDTPSTGSVTANRVTLSPHRAPSLFHEFYNRGSETIQENLRITSSQPCRLELLGLDRSLLAVDCNGDGRFLAEDGDFLSSDTDGDGQPDLPIGGRGSRSVEILAWPLEPQSGTEITLDLSLSGQPLEGISDEIVIP